jgi:hypothetical protein
LNFRKAIPFLAAVTAAIGLATGIASPAAAEPADATTSEASAAGTCLEFNDLEWQYDSVGSNKMMASCFDSHTASTFVAVTQVWSLSYWTGFHGCVKVQFLHRDYVNGTDTVLYTTSQQRWGVDAGRSRLLKWPGTMPAGMNWNAVYFVHWRC